MRAVVALLSVVFSAMVVPACGGAVLGDGLSVAGGDAGPSITGEKRRDAGGGIVEAGVTSSKCAVGERCSPGATCRPCLDECDGRCSPLACANGRYAPIPSPLPPRCVADAGVDPPPTCTLPPVDVAVCSVDQDCLRIDKGCYCGARPVFAVNMGYAAIVAKCEIESGLSCGLECAVMSSFRSDDPNGGFVADRDRVVAYCDQTGESGQCRTRIQ
ncbi:MAG: hypothetical protein U0235_34430 [Polyangiaceae bacterium]